MWGGRLRGERSFFVFCCPSGTAFRRPAKFGTPARRAVQPVRHTFRLPAWDYSLIFSALRARSSTPDRRLGRLRGARQGGAGYGATPRQFSYAKLRFAGLGRHRRRRRRAERHGYQSLTARQSRDLLLISGRVDYVNTPPPLHPPRNTPKEGLPTSLAWRGHASCAAGASFPRFACSGDLPPRRVNARVRFRFGCNSVSAQFQR